MRRIGGVLILFLLAVAAASCDKGGSIQTVAPTTVAPTTTEAPATTEAPTTSTTAAPTTTTAAPTTTTTVTVRTTVAATAATAVATTAPRTAATTATTAAAVAALPTGSGCDPNYSGACVPIASDVDCSRSANGPAYVDAKNFRVVGTDIYGLDTDHDGIACES